jgi:hypothetical protein
MRMSDVAIIFLYSLEAEKNVSNHLYWPTGASGVTLGAGYDMRDRDAATIKADMLSIGLSPQAAQTASEGSGRIGLLDAFVFAQKNHSAIALTPDQETSLLRLILPHYERIVQEHVIVNLLQHEFDALVSFAYNPGGKFTEVSNLINTGKIAAAMACIKKRIYSKHKVLAALVRRRNDEVNVYLYGKYVRT